MISNNLREKAILLRKKAKTYSEIQGILGIKIPKGTLSYWFKNIKLDLFYKKKIERLNMDNLNKARFVALSVLKEKRRQYLDSVRARNDHLKSVLKNKDIAKISLASLYLAEGSKNTRGKMTFGNSDPFIIKLFLNLLRFAYTID